MRVAAWIGVVWAAVSAAAALFVVLTTLLAPAVVITIPVDTFWPALPAGASVEGTTATLEHGGFVSAEVTLLGLSTGARVGWAVSQALWCLIPGAIAALVATMAFRMSAGKPFTATIVRFSTVTAVIIALGGVTAQVLGDVAGSAAANELLQWTGAQYPDIAGLPESDLSTWLPRPRLEITFPFWPLAAGLGFATLATICRHGANLQRDTDGLV